jgi:hypothetical protein
MGKWQTIRVMFGLILISTNATPTPLSGQGDDANRTRSAVQALTPAHSRVTSASEWAGAPYLTPRHSRNDSSTRIQPRLADQCLQPSEIITNTEAVYWNSVALEAIRDVKPAPPVVARSLALVNTAMYDAWAAYSPNSWSTTQADKSRRPIIEHTLANKRVAVHYAAYTVLRDLWPQHICFFDSQMLAVGLQPTPTLTVTIGSPTDVGLTAGRRLMEQRHGDGANQLRGYADTSGYQPVNAPLQITGTFAVSDANRWQPLLTPSGSFQGGACTDDGPLMLQRHVVPHFGRVNPFALGFGPDITPTRGPAVLPSPLFDEQALELIRISAGLNDTQKAIAEYWADGPASELPPGHWALIGIYVSQRDGHTLDDDIKMFFPLTNATMDAGIQAWKIKRQYDNSRPITALRERFKNVNIRAWQPEQGTQTIRGNRWLPFQQLCFVTPPFAEFVSGHSTFSAAAAEVLRSYTGSDAFGVSVVISQGSSFVEPFVTPSRTLTLTWPTFSAAADEAGLSRRYGGIHFAEADVQGRLMGREVGRRAWTWASFLISNSVTLSQTIYVPMALQNSVVISATQSR